MTALHDGGNGAGGTGAEGVGDFGMVEPAMERPKRHADRIHLFERMEYRGHGDRH
jgi:hypothetical protein